MFGVRSHRAHLRPRCRWRMDRRYIQDLIAIRVSPRVFRYSINNSSAPHCLSKSPPCLHHLIIPSSHHPATTSPAGNSCAGETCECGETGRTELNSTSGFGHEDTFGLHSVLAAGACTTRHTTTRQLIVCHHHPAGPPPHQASTRQGRKLRVPSRSPKLRPFSTRRSVTCQPTHPTRTAASLTTISLRGLLRSTRTWQSSRLAVCPSSRAALPMSTSGCTTRSQVM